jgi:hypothetical protein
MWSGRLPDAPSRCDALNTTPTRHVGLRLQHSAGAKSDRRTAPGQGPMSVGGGGRALLASVIPGATHGPARMAGKSGLPPRSTRWDGAQDRRQLRHGVTVDGRQIQRRHDVVEHGQEQRLPVGNVAGQRYRRGAELVGHPSHAERVDAFPPSEPERCLHHGVTGGPARSAAAVTAARPRVGETFRSRVMRVNILDNRGIVVSHVGLNLDRHWDDFKSLDMDDQQLVQAWLTSETPPPSTPPDADNRRPLARAPSTGWPTSGSRSWRSSRCSAASTPGGTTSSRSRTTTAGCPAATWSSKSAERGVASECLAEHQRVHLDGAFVGQH